METRDVCQLTFDRKIIPKSSFRAIRPRSRGLSRPTSHYRQQTRGNENSRNQPGVEIALLNHVSAYVGQTLLCRSSPGYETSGLVLC